MPRYAVYGTVTVGVTIYVDAEDQEGAKEAAYEEWPGLTNYCGNGATFGRLIGHEEENIELDAGEDMPEWTSVDPALA